MVQLKGNLIPAHNQQDKHPRVIYVVSFVSMRVPIGIFLAIPACIVCMHPYSLYIHYQFMLSE